MNNKQLAEMIKALRKKKLEEQDPQASSKLYLKQQQFKPVHIPDPYDKKDASPNDYAHRMAEAAAFTQQGVGSRYNPRVTVGNVSKLPSDRRSYQARGNQSRDPGKYHNSPIAEEETEDLGNTDTKKKSQKVTITPEIEQFGKQ